MKRFIIIKRYILIASLLILVSGSILIAYFCDKYNCDQYNTESITVVLVGDILLDRGVKEKIEENGYAYPFKQIKNEIRKADIAFGNLECPITISGVPALKESRILFKADPENAASLKDAGFDILNLANNHTMDYGREGMENTKEALKQVGILTLGAGENRNSARKPVYMEQSGVTIGFLGFSVFPTEGYFYFDDRMDISQLVIEDLSDEVRNAKAACDFLIVSFHWGREFDCYPTTSQKEAAHLAIDSGADVVVGHHPHVLQGIETYKGKPVFYSLGNFVFDRQQPLETDKTILLRLNLKGNELDRIEIMPLIIVDCQPVKPDSDISDSIIKNLIKYSEGMNTDFDTIYPIETP